jgi:hypothetical protein
MKIEGQNRRGRCRRRRDGQFITPTLLPQDICRKRQRYTLPPSHRDTARQMHDLLGKNYWHQRDYSQNIINIASLNAIQQNKLNSGDNTIRCSQHHRIQEYY